MYEMQDYIDAQFGGPGKGFYRIVTNPFQARKVINAGKMAVVMGIETSVPFGCTIEGAARRRQPGRATLGAHRPAARRGARAGRAADGAGQQVRQRPVRRRRRQRARSAPLVNSANFLETGTFWDMRHCEPADAEARTTTNQLAAPGDLDAEQQDALFGAIAQLCGAAASPALPVYPPPDHCNARGLTTLGEHTIKRPGRAAHDLRPRPHEREARGSPRSTSSRRCSYPGVVSSHSWSTPDAYPRIYQLGGFIAPYAGDSTGLRREVAHAPRLGRPALLLRASATAPT